MSSERRPQTLNRRPTARSQRWKTTNQSRAQRPPQFNSFVTKSNLNGGRIPVGENPPDVTSAPWIRTTLIKSFSGSWSMKADDILDIMRHQLDPTNRGFNQTKDGDTRFVVQYRLLKVRVWNLTGRVISLACNDHTDAASAKAGTDQLIGAVDTGSPTHTPGLGYLYPAALRNIVLRTGSFQATYVLIHAVAAAGDQCIIYIDIAYRFDGPFNPPTMLNLISEISITAQQSRDILTGLSNTASNQERSLAKLDNIVTEIRRNQPSTVKTTVRDLLVSAIPVLMSGVSDDAAKLEEIFAKLAIPDEFPDDA